MYKIQANASGTRSINVTDEHLATVKKYSLLRNLIDSTGFIDEGLIDLCLDVIYNKNMKAFGLHQLVLLYIEWDEKNNGETEMED